ncbi:MAG: hypothetical protein R3D98_10220 [Candidatus Krumholzibacteriia bacterium]
MASRMSVGACEGLQRLDPLALEQGVEAQKRETSRSSTFTQYW